MRLWVTALVFLCAGGVLAWSGGARFADAWPRSSVSLSGSVSDVEAGALAGGTKRIVFWLEGQALPFELAAPFLPHPTAGQLADSGVVTVDYDRSERIRAGDGKPVRIVTGLTTDGRVYFTAFAYRMGVVLWALAFVVPGLVMFVLGTAWIYRLSGNPYWRPQALIWRRTQARAVAFAASAMRDRRKTVDGEWLH